MFVFYLLSDFIFLVKKYTDKKKNNIAYPETIDK